MTSEPIEGSEASRPVHPPSPPKPVPTPPAPRPGAHDWWLTDDLNAFLGRAGAFLRGAPALNTVLLTVADSLRQRGPHAFGAGTPQFGACTDGAGRVRGAFLCTPPLDLLLAPLPAAGAEAGAAAMAVLADRLAPRMPHLPGVYSDHSTAAAFAAAWQRRTGATATVTKHLRLYRLGTLTPPDPAPPGRPRLAAPDDRDLLIRWSAAFQREVGGEPLADAGGWADTRIADGGAVLWETPEGTPACLAGGSRPVAGQSRVFPVYTPPELRGRGYAGAATATMSRLLREAGAREVLLFTDLANPTSNALYQRLGYRPVRGFEVHGFTRPPEPGRIPPAPQRP